MRLRATRLSATGNNAVKRSLPYPLSGVAAASAVSVHLLRGEYAGPLIRVRRSSDSAEQDFFADLTTRYVNTAQVLAFCGSADGFLVAAYDQSGNARHQVQPTPANQMQVVSAGVWQSGCLVSSVTAHAFASAVPIDSSGWTIFALETNTPTNTATGNVAASFTVNNVNGAREWVGTMPGSRQLGHRPAGGIGNVAFSGGISLDPARTLLRVSRVNDGLTQAWINGAYAGDATSGAYAGPTVPVGWGSNLDITANQPGARRQALIVLSGQTPIATANLVEARLLAIGS